MREKAESVARGRVAGADPADQPEEPTTILIVDDDPTLQSALAFSFDRHGYRVLRAGDGGGALSIARAERDHLDLVLLDVMLPGLDGLTVLRRIRSFSDVPIIMLTARGSERDRVDGLELGADDYVVKPFSLPELHARVRSAVRRHGTRSRVSSSVLRRGELTIEPDRRRAVVGETELSLRPKEFGLLVTLAAEPGRVFHRQELLDLVWGEDVIVDARTIDVHVSWLRGKLQRAGMPGDVIRTIYGVGYRFSPETSGASIAGMPAPV